MCIAVRTGHRPFCRSAHPAMPEAVRKLTLQAAGRWVEPGPPSPVEPTPRVLPRNPYRAQIAAVQGCLYGSKPSCGCASRRKCWKVGREIPIRDCYICTSSSIVKRT